MLSITTNMLRRLATAAILFVALALPLGQGVLAQEPGAQTYLRGKVLDITSEGTQEMAGIEDYYQTLLIEIVQGEDKGEVVTIEYVVPAAQADRLKLDEGKRVIVAKVFESSEGPTYYILDEYRLPAAGWLVLLFVLVAIAIAGWRGLTSLLGLGVSLLILMAYVVPSILAGGNPVMISAVGSVMIAVVSLVLAHGLNRRTGVALGATLIALFLAFLLASVAVVLAKLSGSGTEEAVYLQLGFLESLDLRGLLLGGIVIGALGVLDDVTTAQVAAVHEIRRANARLGVGELYKRGLAVGKEHIAALVNTLALAYAGASFPLFLLFAIPDGPPLWVVVNAEYVMEEVVRALVGGGALMLAVPISTALAAYVFGTWGVKDSDGEPTHIH